MRKQFTHGSYALCDGNEYILYRDVIRFAEHLGIHSPVDARGNIHPGTVLNPLVKRVLKLPAPPKDFPITRKDFQSVDVRNSANLVFVSSLEESKDIGHESVKFYRLDLINARAEMTCIRLLFKRYGSDLSGTWKGLLEQMPELVLDTQYRFQTLPVRLENKEFNRMSERKDAGRKSLLDKAAKNSDPKFCPPLMPSPKNKQKSVVEMMLPEEKAAVRKYFRLVRETRENGRPYTGRNNDG